MEDPPAEITQIIHLLTQSPPSLQQATIERYFALNASFKHPICRTGSFAFNPGINIWPFGPLSYYTNSRWLIKGIYRWYKILSPKIELEVDSVAYDRNALVLYVSLHQVVQFFFFPSIFAMPVHLVTVIHLTPVTSYSPASFSESEHTRYWIQAQNDLYQVNEIFKLFSLLRILWTGLWLWQVFATFACVLGQWIFWPISRWEEGRVGRSLETRREIAESERERKTEVEKPD